MPRKCIYFTVTSSPTIRASINVKYARIHILCMFHGVHKKTRWVYPNANSSSLPVQDKTRYRKQKHHSSGEQRVHSHSQNLQTWLLGGQQIEEVWCLAGVEKGWWCRKWNRYREHMYTRVTNGQGPRGNPCGASDWCIMLWLIRWETCDIINTAYHQLIINKNIYNESINQSINESINQSAA